MAPLGLVILFAILLAAAGGRAARADAYLEDARTARAVRFVSPRAPLGECLRLISEAAGVPLSAAPSLEGEPLVAYVPRRPLRETMGALAELFDAAWSPVPVSGESERGYRLEPVPVRAAAARGARDALLRTYREAVDRLAAGVVRQVKATGGVPDGRTRSLTLGLVLWSCLTPAQRAVVFQGESVTAPVPPAQAPEVNRILNVILDKNEPGTSQILVTADLDDRSDRDIPLDEARPSIRTRVTTLRGDAIVGAVGFVDFLKLQPAPALP